MQEIEKVVEYMDYLKNLVEKNRSYRSFDSSYMISTMKIEALLEISRKVASGRNIQPIRYKYCNSQQEVNKIFPLLSWATLYSDWNGPNEFERPSCYVIICLDSEIAIQSTITWCDIGIAAQTILLCAVDQGLGGCMIAAFNKKELAKAISIEKRYVPQLVIAIGKPIENIVLEDANGHCTSYYRDANGIHHVPKRKLKDIIL